ncbi:MAG TPA: PPC domain-containing DNA-binding protein [Candidatus Saccharimonadales bacterium]
MTYTFDGLHWFMVLEKGEQLSTAFKTFFAETDCKSAWVQAIGGALSAELGYYNLETKEYQWRRFDGLREVVSLQGNIALSEAGEPVFHLHTVLADENYQTIGGHVKDLVAGATLEIFVHQSQHPLLRKMNTQAGLPTLQF